MSPANVFGQELTGFGEDNRRSYFDHLTAHIEVLEGSCDLTKNPGKYKLYEHFFKKRHDLAEHVISELNARIEKFGVDSRGEKVRECPVVAEWKREIEYLETIVAKKKKELVTSRRVA